MIYIDQNPNPSGAYPSGKNQPFPGCVMLTDKQAAIFKQYNGFVVVSQGKNGETVVTPNTEAWEAWKGAEAAKPVPAVTPTLEERVDELDEALNMILTGVTE